MKNAPLTAASRRFGRAAALNLILAAICHAQTPPAPVSAPAEQRIVQVRIVNETGTVLAENPPRLPFEKGANYSSDAVRETIRQLFRTGRYADLRAELTDVPGGVRLDFVVLENLFIGVVRVEGLREPPTPGRALAALQLGLGEGFRESSMKESLERLQGALRDDGFYLAQSKYKTVPHPETRQIDIVVTVEPGPRAKVGAVTIHGYTAEPAEKLRSTMRLKAGRGITAARLDRAAERLRKHIAGKGRLGARATLRRGEYDAAANTVPLDVELTAGPRVRVDVVGAKISDKTLHTLLPMYQEGSVDEDLLQEGRRKIRDWLERDGFFDSQVQVASALDAKSGEQVITYAVERGSRRRLVGIDFSGNKYFSKETLRGRLNIQEASFLSRGRFRHSLLLADEEALREIYSANGFRQAEVNAELEQKTSGVVEAGDDLRVQFNIQEGVQTLVSELKVEGNRALEEETLRNVIGSSPGQPYSEFNVSSDRDNILALYFNEGFSDVRFEPDAAEDADTHRVRLTYRITEGPQTRVKQIQVSGMETTRPGVIRREIQLKEGQPLREGEVLETQRRLYDLGIFSRVGIVPQNPTGTEDDKTMLVQVEEAKRYTIAYGGGVEVQRLGSSTDPTAQGFRASPRGLFEISRGNVGGRAHTLAFKVRASTLQGRALLSYAAPNFLANPNFTFLMTGLADKTSDVRTFTSTRYEATVQFAQRWTVFSTLLYRYTFRRVLVDANSLKVAPAEIPLFSQPTKISGFGATYVRERRDNPADPTHGNFNTLDLSAYLKRMGSTSNFVRLYFQNSTFHPLGHGIVFARSARIGIQEPFSGSASLDIPLPERFFAGGGNSLRGFGLNQAGPRDAQTGFPLGGLAMLVFNQEIRFPTRLPFIQNKLGGALFYDAGNVFSRANRITFRSLPASPTDQNYFSHTVGIGFRYGTPIGPVRLDIGFLLNRGQFNVQCTTGSPGCPTGTTLSRLPRFQFSFNIGSIF